MKETEPDIASRLATQAGVRLHRRPGVDLVAVDDAHAFLDACEAHDIRILGVEGFYLRNDEIWVDMERIADFSSATVAESIAEARRFIDEVTTAGLMVDFCLDVDDTGQPRFHQPRREG